MIALDALEQLHAAALHPEHADAMADFGPFSVQIAGDKLTGQWPHFESGGAAVDPLLAPGARKIDAELGQVAIGTRAGRRCVGDIVLVNPFGMSIEDIAVASEVYRIATQLGLGVWLER